MSDLRNKELLLPFSKEQDKNNDKFAVFNICKKKIAAAILGVLACS